MRAINARVTALEHAAGISDDPLPTIFIRVTDASRPDPDAPEPRRDYSDDAITGVRASRSASAERIDRLPGESIAHLQARASKMFPDSRLFFMCYLGDRGSDC